MFLDQWTERKSAAELCLMRRILRQNGFWSLIFGVIALVSGFASLHESAANTGLIVLGFLLLVEGIWILKAPSPSMILAESGMFMLLAAWNLGIMELGGSLSGPWVGVAIFQILIGITLYRKYKRFADLANAEPSRALCQQFNGLIKRALKGNPRKQQDVVLLTTFKGRWKIGLFGEEALMVHEKGHDLCLARREDVKLSEDGKVALGKDRKLTLEVGDRKWKGQMNPQQYERFENWARLIAPPPPLF